MDTTQMTKGDKVTILGRDYEVIEVHGVGEATRRDLGVVAQYTIKGARGAVYFLQNFDNGKSRAIGLNRVLFEGVI